LVLVLLSFSAWPVAVEEKGWRVVMEGVMWKKEVVGVETQLREESRPRRPRAVCQAWRFIFGCCWCGGG
jgi:hypothetical protein